MVRLNRIYTKTGDDGSTGLGDGTRLPKHHLRISSYGTVDEVASVRVEEGAIPSPAEALFFAVWAAAQQQDRQSIAIAIAIAIGLQCLRFNP